MHQKKEKNQPSSSQKHKRNIPDRSNQERKGSQTLGKGAENRSQNFKERLPARKSSDSEKLSEVSASSKKKSSPRFEYEDDYIFWCKKCNLPLIGEECGICGGKGEVIHLSQPADVRFCSPYEREVLAGQLDFSLWLQSPRREAHFA